MPNICLNLQNPTVDLAPRWWPVRCECRHTRMDEQTDSWVGMVSSLHAQVSCWSLKLLSTHRVPPPILSFVLEAMNLICDLYFDNFAWII